MYETTIEVVVRGQKHAIHTGDTLAIDRHDLDNELARQAALYAWYDVLREHARAERVELEAELDDLSYDIDLEIRPDMKNQTETAVKAKIRSDPRYKALAKNVRKLEQYERLLLVVVEALIQRKSMLSALAQSRHMEMSSMTADEVERVKRNIMGR